MKAVLAATVCALAVVPGLAGAASAAQATGGSWSFTDYTADPSSLAADDAFHAVTGTRITSYCHGSRVPSSPQDVTSHLVSVSAPATLRLHLNATGAWGMDVVRQHGTALAGITTAHAATDAAVLRVSLRPGRYVVQACNLGGAPTARVDYRLS